MDSVVITMILEEIDMPSRTRVVTQALGLAGVTLALGLLAGPLSAAGAKGQQVDLILQNGMVLDGSGGPRYQADVAVEEGRIAAVGDLDNYRAPQTVDAEGLFVTPGFVSVHAHPRQDALDTARNMLTMGVTTEILGPDGDGAPGLVGELRQLQRDQGLAVNVGAYIGFDAVWNEVVGTEDRDPTAAETGEMRELIETALADGVWGVSSGLEYVPGSFASTEQVIDVVDAAQGWRTQYPSHIRNEATTVIDATAEAIRIGEQAGMVPVITHMKVAGSGNWGKSVQTVGLIQDAIAQGTYTAADQYPYLAGAGGLNLFIPDWVEEGGVEAMLARFADPELRPRIAEEIEQEIILKVGSADGILLREGPENGRFLSEVAADMGVGPGEAVMRLIEQAGEDISMNDFYGSMEDLVRILQNPTTAVSCDCGSRPSATHPRHFGAFPRVLGRFVREQGLLTWENAVRKMTGLPATQLGMVSRGFIAEGMVADITVFDPNTIIDRATFEEPSLLSEGVEYVLVNGQLALGNGEVTGATAGRVLERSTHMPTRPMSSDDEISVSARGVVLAEAERKGRRPVRVSISVQQDGPPTQASGNFELRDLRRHLRMEALRIGQVQATETWASFTGMGRASSGERLPFLVLVEEADPFDSKERATVTVRVGDEYTVSGVIRPSRTVRVEVN